MFERNGGFILEAYMDIDHVGSVVDERSTIGHCTLFDGNFAIKRSKK